MNIRRLQLLEGAAEASGVAVVIDVLRASSNILTMFSRGASAVIPVATVEEARELKTQHPERVLAGERQGLPPAGFDLGNSPCETERLELEGKTVIITTSAGSRGLVAAAQGADEVLVGCFLNAAAVVRHIRETSPDTVSFVALGTRGEVASPEDDLAAEYMHRLLDGLTPDFEAMRKTIREHPSGLKFLDPENRNYRAEDLEFCLQTSMYEILPRLNENGVLVVR